MRVAAWWKHVFGWPMGADYAEATYARLWAAWVERVHVHGWHWRVLFADMAKFMRVYGRGDAPEVEAVADKSPRRKANLRGLSRAYRGRV